MSVWFCIPSIRPVPEAATCVKAWQAQRYKVALLRQGDPVGADVEVPTGHYLGWAASINLLAKKVLAEDPEAMWIVAGGDDTLPDMTKRADEIAGECSVHFRVPGIPQELNGDRWATWKLGTFGVMQPIGDLKDWPGSRIDNFAGSPWMGREWCERIFGGNGPLWGEFKHMHGDEHLQCVAQKLGVFWQRPDLTHKHMHWGRRPGGARREDIPDFLQEVNTREHWEKSVSIFNRLKAGGFAEAEDVLPVESTGDAGYLELLTAK